MTITATLTHPRHLAAVHAAYAATIPTTVPPTTAGTGGSVEGFVQLAIEQYAEQLRDTTRSDAISTAAFIRRIPAQSYLAILAAAEVVPELQAYLARLDAEPLVWLGSDETIAGVQALVGAGLLTQEQASALLAY
jgi:hypothetical protein